MCREQHHLNPMSTNFLLSRPRVSQSAPNTAVNCRCILALAWFGLEMCFTVPSAFAAPTDDVYLLGPDSQPHDGVPKGKVIGPLTLASQVFTNTTRHYWIYVPAQYDPKTAARLMIFQDGHAFLNPNGDYRVPHVFDNLIHRREMP